MNNDATTVHSSIKKEGGKIPHSNARLDFTSYLSKVGSERTLLTFRITALHTGRLISLIFAVSFISPVRAIVHLNGKIRKVKIEELIFRECVLFYRR
jgi:hypothetical protein